MLKQKEKELVRFFAGVDLVLIETSLFFICTSCCSYCVRRKRTRTNRVVFTEITLAGFVDQCRGYRS